MLDHEVETRHIKIALIMFNSLDAKNNFFCLKTFVLFLDADKIVQEKLKVFI